MATAGWCGVCGQYVYLTEQWGCLNGHAWSEISAWYDTESGQPVTPYWLQPQPAVAETPASAPEPVAEPAAEAVPAPAPAPEPVAAEQAAAVPAGTRDAVLMEIMSAITAHGGYSAAYGGGGDIALGNQVVDANWGVGAKKVTYEAVMRAVEAERTLYFWEVLKESGGGVSFGGADFEASTTSGTKRWGVTKEVIVGPGGVVADYSWDYGATRKVVEEIASRHGWRVKTVLSKKKAMW